jgi:hypothetical protein
MSKLPAIMTAVAALSLAAPAFAQNAATAGGPVPPDMVKTPTGEYRIQGGGYGYAPEAPFPDYLQERYGAYPAPPVSSCPGDGDFGIDRCGGGGQAYEYTPFGDTIITPRESGSQKSGD